MIIYSVIADEPPKSCLDCPFSRRYDSKNHGYCSALPPDNRTVCLEYYADYRRHDCPISFCTKDANET